MALNRLILDDTFLEWCDKTNAAIDLLNNQLSVDVLNLLTTVSKTTLVAAINEVNDEKLDKQGGVITDSLQINGELDVKNNIRVGSDLVGDAIIKLYDTNKLKYKNFGWSADKKYLFIENDKGEQDKILTNNSTLDLNNDNIELIIKKSTSNVIKSQTGVAGKVVYSQDDKKMYYFDGTTKGGYKLLTSDDVGDTSLVKISPTDTANYLGSKFTSDVGLRVSTTGSSNNQRIQIQSNTFVGEVKLYAGVESSIPTGWMKCDGRLLNRTTYKDLFSKIGTIYGAGDGKTTFALPNMSGRVPVGQGGGYNVGSKGGEATHKLTVSEIPEHKHIAPFSEAYGNDPWGLVSKGHYGSNGGRDFDNWWAYTSPVGGNQPHNNMQPYLTMFYIIFTGKY